jgi:pyruvate formate lyase activating enzyme
LIAHVPVRTATLFGPEGAEASRGLSGIAAVVKESRLDWPGRSSATIILSGCDLRCPYCFVPEHANAGRAVTTLSNLAEQIAARADAIDGVVVSGGEPTVSPALRSVLESLREMGLPAKVDTNGTSPELLADLIADDLIAFVSLDVKTTPDRYDRLTGGRDVWRHVEGSIALLQDSGIDHEFRTTCYPFAVSGADLPSIAARLSGGRRYVLQQFIPRRTLDPAATTVAPIGADELRRAAIGCSVHLPTIVRGA